MDLPVSGPIPVVPVPVVPIPEPVVPIPDVPIPDVPAMEVSCLDVLGGMAEPVVVGVGSIEAWRRPRTSEASVSARER